MVSSGLPSVWDEVYKINAHDVDARGRMKAEILFAYILNTAWRHANASDFSFESLDGVPEWDETLLEEIKLEIEDIPLDVIGFDSIPDFQPTDGSEQPRLDQKKKVTCPECGCEFTA